MNLPVEYNGYQVVVTSKSRRLFFIDGDIAWPLPDRSLVVVCAWCRKESAIEYELNLAGHKTSHGICKPCMAKEGQKQPRQPVKVL